MDTTSTTEAVNSYWNSPACIEGYDAGHAEGIGEERDDELWLEELRVRIGDAGRVLDMGCGTGFVSVLLASLGHSVCGVDQSENMLDAAQAKADARGVKVDLVQSSVLDLPSDLGVFDAGVARWVFWTLPDPQAAVGEAFKVLKPGGKFIVYDGLWFRSDDVQERDTSTEKGRIWNQAYTDETRSELPLMYDASPEKVAEMFREVGFVDVEPVWMTEISEEYQKARPRDEMNRLYYVSGVKPL